MKIWILGSGSFGIRAARQLARRHGPGSLTLVDPSEAALDGAEIPGIATVCDEGAAFLLRRLEEGRAPEWIVPALPVHLVWEWAVLALGQERLVREELPAGLVSSLPNAMTGDSGDVYVSHADFICPPDCPEPDRFCTKTGAPRKEEMFRLLEREAAAGGPAPFVVRSLQLGPGVGGYQPDVLLDLLARLERHRGPCLVATACRCHGVVTGGLRL